MIIINSNNPNNVIALDKTSSAVTFILKSNLSKIKFDSLNSNSESKILVGINENLEYDEFIIKSNNTSIFIEASNIKFLRYGVYTLLEIFGFKKFTSKVMYVPESNYLEFPKNFHKKYKPSFSYRGLLYPDVYDEQYRDWHKLDWYKEDFGIWGHSFSELLNPKELYNSNPEFYALYEGKRNDQSICMSNEDSFNLLVEEFEKKIINNPARYYSISQNDDVVYCECKSCKKLNEKHGGPQGSLYYFLNKIANKFPRIKITTLAYLHTFKPPINLEIAPNIITILCPIDENKGKSYTEQNNLSFLNNLSDWKKTNQNLWVWDYMVQFSNYQNHFPIAGVIHFAASKAVNESIENPLLYYNNNVNSLVYLLDELKRLNNIKFVFSSSCTVYGQADEMPIKESAPLKKAMSPYGFTKQIGEQIIQDIAKVSSISSIILRYFNPIGAHPSAHIGELPNGVPQNLIPFITQTAAGIREELSVYGVCYPTKDGTAVRDYIHVVDLAKAHVSSLNRLIQRNEENVVEIYNVGTGNGSTVLEVIDAFEKIANIRLNFKIVDKRQGDIAIAYASTEKIQNHLNWSATYSLEDALESAWIWQQKKHT